MRRKLFNLASAVSLIMFVATGVLWILSYSWSMSVRYVHDSPAINQLVQIHYHVVALRGGFSLYLWHHHATTPESVNELLDDHNWHPALELLSARVEEIDAAQKGYQLPPQSYLFKPTSPSPLGFQFSSLRGVYRGNHAWMYAVAIPFWLPVTLFSILPILTIRRIRRSQVRAKRGLCRACGYDLRATLDRCPECGTPVAKKDVAVKPGS
jgi:hypothetical protein